MVNPIYNKALVDRRHIILADWYTDYNRAIPSLCIACCNSSNISYERLKMDLLAPPFANTVLFVFFRMVSMDTWVSNRRCFNLAFVG